MRHFAILALLSLSSALLAQETTPPAKPIDPAEIARLIEQLDADKFDDRDTASTALLQIGEPAKDALEKALQTTKSAEVKVRATYLLKQIRVQKLQRNALKLDGLYQMARDVCDDKAEAADMEPIVDRILEAIGAVDRAAARAPPVKISACKPGIARGAAAMQSLIVGGSNLAFLRGSTAVFDAGGHISHANDSIVVAWGVVDISHATNCIVIAGADVSIAHANNCLVLAGGALAISHTTSSTLGSAESLESSSFNQDCFLVNTKLPVPARVVGKAGGVVNLDVPGIVLSEKPVMDQLLADKLKPTFMSEQFMIFNVPGQPGEFVARPGSELLDPFGRPAPGLAGWKMLLVADRFAAFEKGEERTFVRWKRE
jgi:hypothetical protein